MIETWTTFLLSHGARRENGVVRDFGDPQAERHAWREGKLLVELSSLSSIRVSGAEAKAFLNAQLTNDVELVDATHSQLSAWCSAQGRMLAVFRVLLRDGDYYLLLPAALRDEIVKRLRTFVLRAKVKVENADAGLVHIGLVEPGVESLLHAAIGQAPQQDNASLSRDGLTVVRVPGIHPRFIITAPVAEAIALWGKLTPDARAAAGAAWEWHDIMAGVPIVLPQTREEFVPQMANLELVGGVSFKKGCYPGQEIVARMQYLGRLKQRMYRAHVATDPVAPGTPLFAPGGPGQSVGTVMAAQASPDDGTDLLAVVQIAAVEAGELRLGNDNGAPVVILPLPYPLAGSPSQKAS